MGLRIGRVASLDRRTRWLRMGLTPLLGVSLVAFLVVGFSRSTGQRVVRPVLSTDVAWFANDRTGEVSLVDGPSRVQIAKLSLAARDSSLEVIQAGSSAYMLNRTDGTLSRVDGATLQLGPPLRIGQTNDSPQVLTDGRTLWIIQGTPAVVERVDATHPSLVFSEQTEPGPLGSAVLTSKGVLWVTAGDVLRSFTRRGQASSARVPQLADARLSLVQDRPVLIDRLHGRVAMIDPARGALRTPSCSNLPTDQNEQFGTSDPDFPLLLAALPLTHALAVTDLHLKSCPDRDIGLEGGSSRDDLGAPVEHDGWAYVPDYTLHSVLVVRLSPSGAASQRTLQVNNIASDTHFDLAPSREIGVWYDDGKGDSGYIDPTQSTATPIVTGQGQAETENQTLPPVAGSSAAPGNDASGTPPTSTGASTTIAGPPNRGTSTVPSGAAEFTFTPAAPTVNQAVRFSDLTSGPVSAVSWVFPGGSPSTSTAASPSVQWTTPGTYTVTLSVTVRGRTLTQQHLVTVQAAAVSVPQPQFSWSPSQPVQGRPITFTDTTVGTHTAVDWTFDQGSPATSTASSPSVTWAAPGTYTVTLVASNGTASAPSQQQITVQPDVCNTQATYTMTANPTAGQPVIFTDTSKLTGHTSSWTFQGGSPTTSSAPQVAVTWSTAGTFAVTLDISSGQCPSISSGPRPLTVAGLPDLTYAKTYYALIGPPTCQISVTGDFNRVTGLFTFTARISPTCPTLTGPQNLYGVAMYVEDAQNHGPVASPGSGGARPLSPPTVLTTAGSTIISASSVPGGLAAARFICVGSGLQCA